MRKISDFFGGVAVSGYKIRFKVINFETALLLELRLDNTKELMLCNEKIDRMGSLIYLVSFIIKDCGRSGDVKNDQNREFSQWSVWKGWQINFETRLGMLEATGKTVKCNSESWELCKVEWNVLRVVFGYWFCTIFTPDGLM